MKKLIGHVSVDSGLIWIGDPCYILHQVNDLYKSLGKDWNEFCDDFDKSNNVKTYNFDNNNEGVGICASSGFGDGYYPVYADIQNNIIYSITIEFISVNE